MNSCVCTPQLLFSSVYEFPWEFPKAICLAQFVCTLPMMHSHTHIQTMADLPGKTLLVLRTPLNFKEDTFYSLAPLPLLRANTSHPTIIVLLWNYGTHSFCDVCPCVCDMCAHMCAMGKDFMMPSHNSQANLSPRKNPWPNYPPV